MCVRLNTLIQYGFMEWLTFETMETACCDVKAIKMLVDVVAGICSVGDDGESLLRLWPVHVYESWRQSVAWWSFKL